MSRMYARTSRSGGRAHLQIVDGHRTPQGKACQRVIANLVRVDCQLASPLSVLNRPFQPHPQIDHAARLDWDGLLDGPIAVRLDLNLGPFAVRPCAAYGSPCPIDLR